MSWEVFRAGYPADMPGPFVRTALQETETAPEDRVAAINPPIDDADPIWKFSIDPESHTDWQKPAKFSPKGKPIRNFSIDPTSSIRTPIADAIFADAISETPRPRSKTSGRPPKPWKNKRLGADIHDPNARTSMTPRPRGCRQTLG